MKAQVFFGIFGKGRPLRFLENNDNNDAVDLEERIDPSNLGRAIAYGILADKLYKTEGRDNRSMR